MPTVRAIIRDAAATDYRWTTLILGLVKSVPFQMNRLADPEAAVTQPQVAR
jgi:hypothetical protein